MSNARENILARLRDRSISAPAAAPSGTDLPDWNRQQRIDRFTQRQKAVHGEVHEIDRATWIDWLREELPKRDLRNVLGGSGSTGEQLETLAGEHIQITRYTQTIEAWKPRLFAEIDVAVTSVRCAIAETGSLVLWPDENEPRLMSLVPSVHIALLDGNRLHRTFAEMIEAENWADGMPTNALLISGPSKTADIEQTLAYGIHGPKQLITLILT